MTTIPKPTVFEIPVTDELAGFQTPETWKSAIQVRLLPDDRISLSQMSGHHVPSNSHGRVVFMPIEDAKKLARTILLLCGEEPTR